MESCKCHFVFISVFFISALEIKKNKSLVLCKKKSNLRLSIQQNKYALIVRNAKYKYFYTN